MNPAVEPRIDSAVEPRIGPRPNPHTALRWRSVWWHTLSRAQQTAIHLRVPIRGARGLAASRELHEAVTPMTTGTETVPDIDDLRREIDRLDAEILAAVKRRTEVSKLIGQARMASGGTRLVHSREMKVIERYSELGPDGKDLAMLLLRLGRGRLGH
nr:chorismate mutase [Mycobacterium sp. 852002-51152_SCH6134967]